MTAKYRQPGIKSWLVTAVVVAFGIHFCVASGASASPPVIGDVARPSPKAGVHISETHTLPVRKRVVVDGPMCQAGPTGPASPPTPIGLLTADEPTLAERMRLEVQATSCTRLKGAKNPWKYADPYLLLGLMRLEEELNVPVEARGILAAAWCWEAGFRSSPRAGDEGMSFGPYQQQAWFWSWCGGKGYTYDIVDASTCYWSRVDYYLQDGKCPGSITRAEAMAANGVKYKNYGCSAKSLHWKELERWNRIEGAR